MTGVVPLRQRPVGRGWSLRSPEVIDKVLLSTDGRNFAGTAEDDD
jgi:hypothetical protein